MFHVEHFRRPYKRINDLRLIFLERLTKSHLWPVKEVEGCKKKLRLSISASRLLKNSGGCHSEARRFSPG